jgi:hypothetical protein
MVVPAVNDADGIGSALTPEGETSMANPSIDVSRHPEVSTSELINRIFIDLSQPIPGYDSQNSCRA